MRPIVLDLDASAGAPEGAAVLPLRAWGEVLRFACSARLLQRFDQALAALWPGDAGPVFTGSGDYHHLSLPLIERVAAAHGPLELVVFDNHPDNMRFPFGVHCGSWVRRACLLPGVAHVHVVGITSGDIGLAHAWENRLRPLIARRLTYWSSGVDVRWAHALGLGPSFRSFDGIGALIDAFTAQVRAGTHPVYLSIDKDVLSPEDVRTNWDQGRMREAQLVAAIRVLTGRIVGCDITGEVSQARYTQGWKRALSALDRQPTIPDAELARWQEQQHALNARLVRVIGSAWIKGGSAENRKPKA